MSPLATLLVRRAIALAIAAIVFNVVSDRAFASGFATCPARADAVAASAFATVWVERGTLMSCSAVGGGELRVRKLGRWAGPGELTLQDATVGWTQRRGGTDRVYAADLASPAADPRFLRGARPTSGRGRGKHGRVAELTVRSYAVAWITESGLLSVALSQRRVELGRRHRSLSNSAALAGLQIEQVADLDPASGACTARGEFAVSAPVSGPAAEVTISSRFATGLPGC